MSDLSAQPLPVICDSCRATGMAGDAAFSALGPNRSNRTVDVRATRPRSNTAAGRVTRLPSP